MEKTVVILGMEVAFGTTFMLTASEETVVLQRGNEHVVMLEIYGRSQSVNNVVIPKASFEEVLIENNLIAEMKRKNKVVIRNIIDKM